MTSWRLERALAGENPDWYSKVGSRRLKHGRMMLAMSSGAIFRIPKDEFLELIEYDI